MRASRPRACSLRCGSRSFFRARNLALRKTSQRVCSDSAGCLSSQHGLPPPPPATTDHRSHLVDRWTLGCPDRPANPLRGARPRTRLSCARPCLSASRAALFAHENCLSAGFRRLPWFLSAGDHRRLRLAYEPSHHARGRGPALARAFNPRVFALMRIAQPYLRARAGSPQLLAASLQRPPRPCVCLCRRGGWAGGWAVSYRWSMRHSGGGGGRRVPDRSVSVERARAPPAVARLRPRRESRGLLGARKRPLRNDPRQTAVVVASLLPEGRTERRDRWELCSPVDERRCDSRRAVALTVAVSRSRSRSESTRETTGRATVRRLRSAFGAKGGCGVSNRGEKRLRQEERGQGETLFSRNRKLLSPLADRRRGPSARRDASPEQAT